MDLAGRLKALTRHMGLADDPNVTTYSEGEGADRHIVIAPRGSVPPEASRRAGAPAADEEIPEDTDS